MTNAYIYNTWNFWYFFIFLLVGLFALQNVLVAVTYNTWRSKTTTDVKERIKKRDETLTSIFQMLAQPDPNSEEKKTYVVTQDVWNQLWNVLRPSYSDQLKRELFWAAKSNELDHLSCEEFKKAFLLLKLSIRQKTDPILLTRFRRRIEKSKNLFLFTNIVPKFC